MKKFLLTLFALMMVNFQHSAFAQKMDNEKLGKIIEVLSDSVEGQAGYWQFAYGETVLLLITDESHNRMRIMTPIVEVEKLNEEFMKNALIANFHTALDVKYAISDEVLWSVFIHPLKELSEEQVKDAIEQVYRAAYTFGTTYSSTDLVFPGSAGEGNEEEKPKKKSKEKKSRL